jgi:tRNA-2-methylthio-N6-dimethylallyladenosine synthase
MKYFIKTYGCQMNKADSEMIELALEKKGYDKVSSWSTADLVVINTCSVRQSAEDRVLGLVNNLKKLREKEKPDLKIILTGCMMRYTIVRLKSILPEVDEFISFSELTAGVKPEVKKSADHSWVKIMEGCNNFCTYCVVPSARGREESRSIEEIYCQVKELVNRGCSQITLLGQNVNSYGKGIRFKIKDKELRGKVGVLEKRYKGNNFAVLLELLHGIKGLKKISFITSNPHDLTDEIIQAMKLPKIDRYFHLAVQSGDDQILKAMNRKYKALQFIKLIEKLRQEIPDIKIGTDIIVGFPGETKAQFNKTVALCKKIGFKLAYISKYSPRPGTAAFKLKDNVQIAEKKRRWQILNDLINK